eukprot:scaffold22671_cov164-Cylindrotheca_fusiformis.AAC.5
MYRLSRYKSLPRRCCGQLTPLTRQFASESENKSRITLALYRQLLQWSNSVDDDVPLSFFVPPVHMSPPQVDSKSLQLMARNDKASKVDVSIFPEGTIVEESELAIPIRNSVDVKKFFRGIFRLNSAPSNPDKQKQRISLAFEGLKSLNELTQALDDLRKSRERNRNRENVEYRVGHVGSDPIAIDLCCAVVQHRVENWRGVIVGWERTEESTDNEEKVSSLTKKKYHLGPADSVKYMVVVDGNDAHLYYSKRRESNLLSIAEVFQSDLEIVKDESLRRIRSSHVSDYFQRFDDKTNTFVPNEMLAYEFPEDVNGIDDFQLSPQAEEASRQIISGVQETGNYLRSVLLGYTSAPESRGLKLLGLFFDKLTMLSEGDVVPVKEKLFASQMSSNKLASLHLQQLLNLTVNVMELLWQKQRQLENSKEIKFGLGDIVRHKVYGFRGVVVAWDPEPTFDVSRWDGLQHIKNPHEFPFYHIIPDQDDCIDAFGAERPSRYVCQENLESCPEEQRRIDVDLEPEWEFNRADKAYTPPDDVKFKYGDDLEDDGITELCLKEIRDILAEIFVSSRDGVSASKPELDALSKQLALSNLLELLKSAQDMEVATVLSESLKEIWKAHLNEQLRWNLDTAVADLLAGKLAEALKGFTEVVDDDPSYAEAWNKAATCEFMMGNMDASLAASKKTIEYLPTHFQALNGMGLVYYEKKDISSAISSFRQSMELDPWSPVSARLSTCLKKVKSNEPDGDDNEASP